MNYSHQWANSEFSDTAVDNDLHIAAETTIPPVSTF